MLGKEAEVMLGKEAGTRCSWRVDAVEKSGAETCRCCGVCRNMPFKQVYVWTPAPGSSGTSLVFGLSDDKNWWVVESMATSMLIRKY